MRVIIQRALFSIASFGLAAGLVIGGCGGSDHDEPRPDTGTVIGEPLRIAVFQSVKTDGGTSDAPEEAAPPDGMAPPDGAPPPDGTPPPEAAPPPDGRPPPDGAPPPDGPPPPDGTPPLPPPSRAPSAPDLETGKDPNYEWAVGKVNEAGGIAGRPLVVEYVAIDLKTDVTEIATSVANDPRYVAAIAPPGTAGLERVVDAFLAAKKPIVSAQSASDDLLRKYGGKGVVWRTRESDIAQTELLVRYAKEKGAKKLGILTSTDGNGATFFGWFGFFARELGYDDAGRRHHAARR
jgi:hypothetical protein